MEADNNHTTKQKLVVFFVLTVFLSSLFGGAMGFWAGSVSGGGLRAADLWHTLSGKAAVQAPPADNGSSGSGAANKVVNQVDEESAVISAVDKVSPAVVSIIITKDLPVIEQYDATPPGMSDFFRQFFGDNFGDFSSPSVPQYRQNGTQQTEIGGGTGFIVSPDGYILTNRHVVNDPTADYTVLMNDETKHEARVLARDPVNDIAVLKIDGENLPTVELGDSSNLKVGQSVIVIGNALGEFRNTVSTGVISGLARSVVAGESGMGSENLSGVIQTDASINPGNSGGPLLNLDGQVIGMNTAMAMGAENIGFAIPINDIKNVYESVKTNGRIVRPWLGVRYSMVDKSVADANNLSNDYGALIVRGDNPTDLAVIPGSPADKAGLVENDIILEVNGQKVDASHPLVNLISGFKPGDKVTLKVSHKGEEKDVQVTLGEAPNS